MRLYLLKKLPLFNRAALLFGYLLPAIDNNSNLTTIKNNIDNFDTYGNFLSWFHFQNNYNNK
jgi:hypothetical protein